MTGQTAYAPAECYETRNGSIRCAHLVSDQRLADGKDERN
jgi:hypothetical protein